MPAGRRPLLLRVAASRLEAPDVTRIVVDGQNQADVYLKVRIDPDDPDRSADEMLLRVVPGTVSRASKKTGR